MKNLLQGDSNPDPQNQLELKVNTSVYWTTSVNSVNWSLKEVYIPFLWWLTVFEDEFFVFFFFNFRVELNLSLTEARRKDHNKPINTLSGLVHAGERLRNLWTIDRSATNWTVWPYDTLPACKVSFHRSGKTLTQHCSSLFPAHPRVSVGLVIVYVLLNEQ